MNKRGLLVDGNGDPLPTSDDCEKCGSSDVKLLNGFGGYWRLICEHCGFEVASGRTKVGE